MTSNKFTVTGTSYRNTECKIVRGFKIVQYQTAGVNFPVEGTPDAKCAWATREEAQAAADRVNAGDESGISLASYADD